jgi:hypothetical protein
MRLAQKVGGKIRGHYINFALPIMLVHMPDTSN